MDIKCLGYKKAFSGELMWHYKLEMDGKEYLFIDANSFGMLDMLWNHKNDFEDATFTKNELKEIIKEINLLPKNDKELFGDDELTFFTKHEIPEPVIPKHKGKTYTADEITEILEVFREFDFTYQENKLNTIDQEVSDYADKTCSVKDLFKKLIGYKVKFTKDGHHKNDGQMVEYVFTFISPDNKKTEIATEMCLMVGWNHCDDEKIR